MPPRAVHPAANGSSWRADIRRKIAVLPADRGPRCDPNTPPAATATRIAACSNHSSAKSATGIGSQRSRLYASFRLRPRNRRPVVSSSTRSAAVGASIDGAGAAVSFRSTPFTAPTLATNAGYRSESRARPGRELLLRPRPIAPDRERRSVDRRHAPERVAVRDLQSMPLQPELAARFRDRSPPNATASATLNPGTISDVIAQPPTRSARSRTSVFRPAFARSVAATRPFTPAPITTMSRIMRALVLSFCRSAFCASFACRQSIANVSAAIGTAVRSVTLHDRRANSKISKPGSLRTN